MTTQPPCPDCGAKYVSAVCSFGYTSPVGPPRCEERMWSCGRSERYSDGVRAGGAPCAAPDPRVIFAPDPPPANCASCRFFHEPDSRCRRRAPVKAEWWWEGWPMTNQERWCGEYERDNGYKPKTDNEPLNPSSGKNPAGSGSSM